MTRQSEALTLRTAAATAQSEMNYGTQETNGDEGLYADYRASFTKALPHNDLGEVDVSAFDTLLGALQTGQNNQFEAVALGGTRKLANPQGAYRIGKPCVAMFRLQISEPTRWFKPQLQI